MLKSFIVTLIFTTAFILNAQELLNGNFQDWKEGAKVPANWKNQTSAISSISQESGGGVRIKITEPHRFHSALVQNINTKNKIWLNFSGNISADMPDMAYLEVKLFKNKKMTGRHSSSRNPGDSSIASINFNTADTDRIELVCRMAADKKYLGKTAVFSKLKLSPGRDPNRTLSFKTGEISPEEFTNCSGTTSVKTSPKSAKIKIEKISKFDSALRLQLDNIPSSQNFFFAADAVSKHKIHAYLSVKLFRKGQEIGRKNSASVSTRKKRLSINFNTGSADMIVLLCRVRQNRNDIGNVVKFEKLILEKGKYHK